MDVRGLTKSFSQDAGLFSGGKRKIYAVNDVSFSIERGQTLGLVGESGSGKTTTARLLLRMYEPDLGTMFLDGEPQDFFTLDSKRLKQVRQRLQYIFQDPYGSLNPKLQVRRLITEPVEAARRLVRQKFTAAERDALAVELCETVGLQASDISRYAHEFSGGQRQRLAIARALSTRPEILVCDEPVSSLDVSIQSQILNLLNDLQKRYGLTYLFIGHNLPVVFYVSDVVAVMYAGRIVEQGPTRILSAAHRHPYTQELKKASLPGERAIVVAPDPQVSKDETGCPFYQRCPLRTSRCLTELPQLREIAPGHTVACHEV